MTGVTFIRSNLDNVFVPAGNTLVDSTQRKFQIQNDLRDWELDATNKPIKVLNEEYWIKEGYSVDPLDIPSKKLNDIKEINKL